MISEIDTWRMAKLMLDGHGEDATVHAAMKADKFMERGDVDTAAVWKSIVQAIKVQIGANLTAPFLLRVIYGPSAPPS